METRSVGGGVTWGRGGGGGDKSHTPTLIVHVTWNLCQL